jgi:hypothetical protein
MRTIAKALRLAGDVNTILWLGTVLVAASSYALPGRASWSRIVDAVAVLIALTGLLLAWAATREIDETRSRVIYMNALRKRLKQGHKLQRNADSSDQAWARWRDRTITTIERHYPEEIERFVYSSLWTHDVQLDRLQALVAHQQLHWLPPEQGGVRMASALIVAGEECACQLAKPHDLPERAVDSNSVRAEAVIRTYVTVSGTSSSPGGPVTCSVRTSPNARGCKSPTQMRT